MAAASPDARPWPDGPISQREVLRRGGPAPAASDEPLGLHLHLHLHLQFQVLLGPGNVLLAAAQEKTSAPGGVFQPNLGRRVRVTVFAFVSEQGAFFKNPLLLRKLVSVLELPPPSPSFACIILTGRVG